LSPFIIIMSVISPRKTIRTANAINNYTVHKHPWNTRFGFTMLYTVHDIRYTIFIYIYIRRGDSVHETEASLNKTCLKYVTREIIVFNTEIKIKIFEWKVYGDEIQKSTNCTNSHYSSTFVVVLEINLISHRIWGRSVIDYIFRLLFDVHTSNGTAKDGPVVPSAFFKSGTVINIYVCIVKPHCVREENAKRKMTARREVKLHLTFAADVHDCKLRVVA